jgi:septation ring formation regulator EzrA
VWQFIKSDCKVTLGSEGIIGDKLLIITQGSAEAPLAKAGQQLESLETIETHTIMSRLDVTTANAEAISRQLSEITFDINMGKGTLSRLIQDSILAENLNQTIANLNRFSKGLIGADVIMLSLKRTAFNAEDISKQLADVINKINKGDGTLGRLIQDTTIAANLKQTALNLRKTSNGLTGTDSIMAKLNTSLSNIEVVSKQLTLVVNKINKGNGTISRLLGDSIMAENLNQAIISLKSSSKGLDENMTAAKHNFLFRGYFERKAKETEQKKQKMALKDTTFKTDIQ